MKERRYNEETNPKKDYITCLECPSDKNYKHKRNFYALNSSSRKHKKWENIGKVPICIHCLRKKCFYENGKTVNMKGLLEALEWLDIPFKKSVYLDIMRTGEIDLGNYKSRMNLGYTKETFDDSDIEEINAIKENIEKEKKEEKEDYDFAFLENKWGNFPMEELIAFEKKYQQLKNNYTEKTAMHTEALLTYIRYRVKEELATAKGDVGDAKAWGALAKDAATAAKINPNQLSKADLTDGLSTFSELSLAIEKEVDIIPILPKFKCRPNDALDFNIWCYVNYERDLSGLPLCSYEDVYKFYDQRKKEYVEQYGDPYGIFSDDTSEKNRENIKKFIKDDE